LKPSHLVLLLALCLGTGANAQTLPGAFAPATDPPQTSSDSSSTAPQTAPDSQDPSSSSTTPDPKSANGKPDSPQPKAQTDDSPQQTKRILWVIPNYRAVSANTQLPPLAVKEKFWLATQDSFDYSAFIWVGMVAGISMAGDSEPAFGQGASGYGIYYAHAFADNTIENYFVEAIVPSAVKQDPRYYTLGHGGFFKRTGYAISRLVITRTDSGRPTVNISEILGAGAFAGIANAYYPPSDNHWVKTYQRWGSQVLQDGLSDIAKEFWPEVNRALFHNKY
jgi:hypothetical protein